MSANLIGTTFCEATKNKETCPMRILLLLIPIVMLLGCVSDQEIYERIDKRKKMLASVVGQEITSVDDSEYRTLVIHLKDGRTIKIESHKHHDEITVTP